MYGRKRKTVKVPSDPSEAFGKALKTAFNILGYKDNTRKELCSKLTERGYSPETADAVCDYMAEKGYLNERRMLIRKVKYMAESRLYGKRRILFELSHKSFDPETLSGLDFECDEELSEIDFVQICLRLLIKKGGQRDQKTYAALMRCGHTPSDIKAAYKEIEKLQEE